MSERTVRMITGLATLVFIAAASVFGVKVAGGALQSVYHVDGLFTSAGQGLIRDSDVKIHGLNIGHVTSVKLVEGKALVRMAINSDERIPVDAKAIIRPKTLFGEKFVDIDPGAHEQDGPFLEDGGRLRDTLGGFELEKVLTDAYPILQAIDPAELAVVIGTLADAARGTGDEINRQIANWRKVMDVNAAHDADTRQFLDDLALLSEELAARAGDVVGAAQAANVALPELNQRGDQLATFLDQAARLSADVADVLEANRPFLEKNVTQGGKTLQVLYEEQARIAPLVQGLRMFFQTLAEAGSHADLELPDGTNLAAIKLIFGGGPPCGRDPETCDFAEGGSSGAAAPAAAPAGGRAPGLALPALPALPPLPVPTTGAEAVSELVGGLLR